jgi:nucleotide-binding universal stress UspA family protein
MEEKDIEKHKEKTLPFCTKATVAEHARANETDEPCDDGRASNIAQGVNMEFKKILWPTDFSKNSSKALPYVVSLGEKYQTEVHVLYVIEDLGHKNEKWYGEFDQSSLDKLYNWENEKAKKRLEDICNNYLEGCPNYIKHYSKGDPASEILNLIDKEKIDMVVMPSRGRKGYFHFGSVAEKVIKNTSVPVVVIPINPT